MITITKNWLKKLLNLLSDKIVLEKQKESKK
jgi:hypothetical protein